MTNSCILVISDLHIPYHHKSTIPFLTDIKNKFKPTRIVLTGDEIDAHAISFHDKDPDTLFSPSSELTISIEYLQPLYKLFPNANIMESNHGSLYYRKAKHHGIPRSVLRSYSEILEAPPGWTWHSQLIIDNTLFVHGKSSNGLNLSILEGMNVVQGHFHSIFEIRYSHRNWAMTVGCLIDDTELAFAYNKLQPKRPIIGVGIILNGIPMLIPMPLDKDGCYDGSI